MPQNVGVTAVPRAFGILSIVFASIVLVGSLFGLLGLVVPVLLEHAPPPSRPQDAQALAMLSSMYLGMGAMSAILSVMSALLLALGIGQLRYRAWAALWSVRWGVVALGAVVVMAILMTTTMRSTLGSIASTANANGDAAAARDVGSMIGVVYAAMVVLFYSPYPILMLAYFSRDRVRAAMTA
ncbi:MAG: hypothetical protein LC659_01715 [Myxococcales bacterium]|nr:hypothetical protein [Myxococcales bacterium]